MRIEDVKYSTDKLSISRHYHNTHQILFVTSGSAVVVLGGQEKMLSEGAILILSRFEEHSIRILNDDYKRYMLTVSSDPSPLGIDNYLLSSILVNRQEGFRHITDTGDKADIFRSIFEKMYDEYSLKAPLFEEKLDVLFNDILIELYRLAPDIFLENSKLNTSVIKSIQSRFENDYSEEFNLLSLASEYHISVSHLAHIFKSVTGYSPIGYLSRCRLSAAKNYLVNTTKPIKEIVDLCGFGDESNFSRMFKAKIGVTPTMYRKNNSK